MKNKILMIIIGMVLLIGVVGAGLTLTTNTIQLDKAQITALNSNDFDTSECVYQNDNILYCGERSLKCNPYKNETKRDAYERCLRIVADKFIEKEKEVIESGTLIVQEKK